MYVPVQRALDGISQAKQHALLTFQYVVRSLISINILCCVRGGGTNDEMLAPVDVELATIRKYRKPRGCC